METNRGKAAGLYIDRKIIKTGKLEDLSEQELEAKMKQILEKDSQIINITPNLKRLKSNPLHFFNYTSWENNYDQRRQLALYRKKQKSTHVFYPLQICMLVKS